MQLNVVDLPAPFTPSKAKHSPTPTPNEVPFTAIVPLLTLLSSSSSAPYETGLSDLADVEAFKSYTSTPALGSTVVYFLTRSLTSKVSFPDPSITT